MIGLSILLGLAAAAALLVGGYLWGAKLGRDAREALRGDQSSLAERARSLELQALTHAEALARAEQAAREAEARRADADRARVSVEERARGLDARVATSERALAEAHAVGERQDAVLAGLRQDLQKLSLAVAERRSDGVALKTQVEALLKPVLGGLEDSRKVREDVAKMISPVLARAEEEEQFRATLQSLLHPLVQQEKLGQELGYLGGIAESRRDLPRVLDAIAERAGFTSVIVSDEVGLPLASNRAAKHLDTLAGASSLLLTFADRLVQGGEPAPLAVVIHDAANQVVVHRIFRARGERYVFTAVSPGRYLPPGALDPAVAVLERVMAREAWETH